MALVTEEVTISPTLTWFSDHDSFHPTPYINSFYRPPLGRQALGNYQNVMNGGWTENSSLNDPDLNGNYTSASTMRRVATARIDLPPFPDGVTLSNLTSHSGVAIGINGSYEVTGFSPERVSLVSPAEVETIYPNGVSGAEMEHFSALDSITEGVQIIISGEDVDFFGGYSDYRVIAEARQLEAITFSGSTIFIDGGPARWTLKNSNTLTGSLELIIVKDYPIPYELPGIYTFTHSLHHNYLDPFEYYEDTGYRKAEPAWIKVEYDNATLTARMYFSYDSDPNARTWILRDTTVSTGGGVYYDEDGPHYYGQPTPYVPISTTIPMNETIPLLPVPCPPPTLYAPRHMQGFELAAKTSPGGSWVDIESLNLINATPRSTSWTSGGGRTWTTYGEVEPLIVYNYGSAGGVSFFTGNSGVFGEGSYTGVSIPAVGYGAGPEAFSHIGYLGAEAHEHGIYIMIFAFVGEYATDWVTQVGVPHSSFNIELTTVLNIEDLVISYSYTYDDGLVEKRGWKVGSI